MQPLWNSLIPGSNNPNIIDVINEWLKEPQFKDHFELIYYDDENWPAVIQCKCPSYPAGHGLSASGVGFIWFQGTGDVLARPLTFYFAYGPVYLTNLHGPEYLTNLHDPDCFTFMTKRLLYLHTYFEGERPQNRSNASNS